MNDVIESNAELFIPTTCIGDVSETENQLKCSNVPLIKPKESMQIFSSEILSTFNDDATTFNIAGRKNLVQRVNGKSEHNTDDTKNNKTKHSFPIQKTIDGSESFKSDATNESLTYPENQIMDLNKGDINAQNYLNIKGRKNLVQRENDEKEVLVNSDNTIEKQTDLQKVNNMIVSNVELFIPTICAPCIGDVSETETENQFKCSNVPLIKPIVSMQIFSSEILSTFNDETTTFNIAGKSNLAQCENDESESNTDKTKNNKTEDSFPIHKTNDGFESFNPDTTNESFAYPENRIMDLNKGDSHAQAYLNKTLKRKSNLLISYKAAKKE